MRNPIRQIRDDKKLNRKQFSHKTGIPYATLCYLETGLTNTMQEKTLHAIAKFTQQEPQELQAHYTEWKEGLQEQA